MSTHLQSLGWKNRKWSLVLKIISNSYSFQRIFINIITLILVTAMPVRKRKHEYSVQKHKVGQEEKELTNSLAFKVPSSGFHLLVP